MIPFTNMLFNYKIQKPCIIYMCDARCTLSEILLWCHLFGLWENSDDKFVNKYGILFGNSLNNNFLSIPNSFHIPLKRGHPSYKPATFSLQKEWYYKRGTTRRMLDTSAPVWYMSVPRQIGTLKRQIDTCVFFFDFTYKASNSKF